MRNSFFRAAPIVVALTVLAACGPTGAPEVAAPFAPLTPPAVVAAAPANTPAVDPALVAWLTRGKWARRADAIGGDPCKAPRRHLDFVRAGAGMEVIRVTENAALAGAIVPLAATTTNRTNLSLTRESVESLRGDGARVVIVSKDANYRWETEIERAGEDAFVLRRVTNLETGATRERKPDERRPDETHLRCRS